MNVWVCVCVSNEDDSLQVPFRLTIADIHVSIGLNTNTTRLWFDKNTESRRQHINTFNLTRAYKHNGSSHNCPRSTAGDL